MPTGPLPYHSHHSWAAEVGVGAVRRGDATGQRKKGERGEQRGRLAQGPSLRGALAQAEARACGPFSHTGRW